MKSSKQRKELSGWMRRIAGGAITLLAATSLTVTTMTAASAETGEVSLRYTLDPGGPPISTRGQELLASDQPIQAVKLPRFHSKKPLYLTARLGEGTDPTYTFALDESEPGAGYDLLYVDTRHNHDLTETEPYRLTRWQYSRGFKPVRLLIHVGGRPALYHAAILVQERPGAAEYRLQSWAYYSGEARFGEKSYPVALVDTNGNGLFNDRSQGADPESAGDALLFDLNGDGKFGQYEFASPELQDAGRRIAVDGRYYDLAIPPDGSSFRVTATTARLATLRSGPEPFALLLLSGDGMLGVHGEKGQAQVPVGDYRIMGWQVEERDRDGSLWKVEGSRERLGGEPRRLSVKADMPLPRLGSPLQAQLQVQPAGGREFECHLSFTGASGEVIGQVQRNGEQMPEPHMRILDARGKQVADVPFHYG